MKKLFNKIDEYSKISNNELMLHDENSELTEKFEKFALKSNIYVKFKDKGIFEKHKRSEENLAKSYTENKKLKKLTLELVQ